MQPVAAAKNRKTLSLALAGCAGKAIAYIGLLEVFQENGIPVDAIAACSSGAIVAGAYACGTLAAFKERAMGLKGSELLDMFGGVSLNGGVFSFDSFEEAIGEFITVEHVEDLPVRTVIVASDLVTGREVVFSMGDVLRAIRASCSMPGLFEPVLWGRQVLVDGGLFSIVPVEAAKLFGCDCTVAVRMAAASKNLFASQALQAKDGYNHSLRNPVRKLGQYASRIGRSLVGVEKEEAEVATIDEATAPGLVEVLARSMDYAIEERKKAEQYSCDLMVEIEGEGYGKVDIRNFEKIYEAGRLAAEAALPRIRELLA